MNDAARHEIGGNEPPPGDPFLLKLEEKNEPLFKRHEELERRRLKLPQATEIDSDEKAGLITAWVVDARKLARDFEAQRVEEKEPYLKRGKLIDGFFTGLTNLLKGGADGIEKRNGPYLKAKADRERAEREERAQIAREEAERRQRELDEQRARERAAEQARQEAEEKLRREAREKQQRDEAARRQQEEDNRPAEPAPPAAPIQTEADLRAAHLEQQRQEQATAAAEEDLRKAQKDAERAERQAAGSGDLGRTAGAGGASKATTVWVAKVDSFPKVLASLGPLGRFLNEDIIRAAVDRAARADRPDIPGVSYSEELSVKTTASRG